MEAKKKEAEKHELLPFQRLAALRRRATETEQVQSEPVRGILLLLMLFFDVFLVFLFLFFFFAPYYLFYYYSV
jgi:hypothetical protein